MAKIDTITFNGTDYTLGASSDSVGGNVHLMTEYGFDFENADMTGGGNKDNYPCDSFNSSVMAIVSLDYGTPYGLNLRLTGLTTNYIDIPYSYHYPLIVEGITYRIAVFNINVDTEYTPQTAPSNFTWGMYVPYNGQNNPNIKNKDVFLVANVPADEITSKFIAEIYSLPHGFSTLRGKKWLALGDSYTNYLCGAYSAWGYLSRRADITLSNYGVASSTIRVSSGDGDYAYSPMSVRVDTLISQHTEDADEVGLVTFMGGINDGYTIEKIGTLASTELTTIYGGCHHIFNSLINAFPNALILVILQPVSGNETATEGGFDAYQNSIYAAQVKQRAVKETAEFYGLPICDCCFDWYTTANPVDRTTIWGSDKIHLTTTGESYLTNKVVDRINKALTID